MGARDRIAAKQVRRVIVPIQLSDPSEDNQRVLGATVALYKAQERGDADETEIADLQRQAKEAEEAVAKHFEPVAMRALPAAEWEALSARHTNESGDGLDWAAALPALVAVSCEDEDLRDADFWRHVFADAAWSEGDADALRTALLHLNISAPDPRLPKG
jgi:hypothetical protein